MRNPAKKAHYMLPSSTVVQKHAQPIWEAGHPHLPQCPGRQPQFQPLSWHHPDAPLPATTAAQFQCPVPLAARQRCSPPTPDPCSAEAPGTGPAAGRPSAAAHPAAYLQHISQVCSKLSRRSRSWARSRVIRCCSLPAKLQAAHR